MDNEMQVYSQWRPGRRLMHRSTSFYPNLASLGHDPLSRDADDNNNDDDDHGEESEAAAGQAGREEAALSRFGHTLAPGGLLKTSPSLLKLNASMR